MSKSPTDLLESGQAVVRQNAPPRENLSADLLAGLTWALVNIPQGMAYALLALVNPAFGLYTLMIATPVAALFTSSVFMNVSSTSAVSVAVGDAMAGIPTDQRAGALVVLVLLAGIIQFLAGVLRFGYFVRFISNAVMTGFMAGVAVLIILGQFGDLTGYDSALSNKVLQTADLILSLGQVDYATTAMGIITIMLIFAFERTPYRKFAYLIALIGVTFAVAIMPEYFVNSIQLVRDLAEIPNSLPRPLLPDLSLIPGMIGPAIAISVIALVQGAGVSQSYPNPDGKFPNPSRDFAGQGLANIAASFFQGIPAGGSVSGTAVLIDAGARSRWANIFAGLFVAICVLLFAGAIELLPMTALAGMLIVIGVRLIDTRGIRTVWQTNPFARAAMGITFIATLITPLQVAVIVGMVVSILLYVARQANEVHIVRWVWPEDGYGYPEEVPAPQKLPSNEVTLLNVYGSLFFAGASTLEDNLPAAEETRHAVVILNLRGRDDIGSTFNGVLQRYAATLSRNDSLLILTGISPEVQDQLLRTRAIKKIGEDNIFLATPQLGQALNQALRSARAWLELDPNKKGASESRDTD
jgi:SulP family sulfate permease